MSMRLWDTDHVPSLTLWQGGVCGERHSHCPGLRVRVRLKVKHNKTGTQCSNSSRFKLNCKTHGFLALWLPYLERPPQDIRHSANLSSFQNKFKHLTIITIKVFIQCKILSIQTSLSIQQNKALCSSWTLHCAWRTEYGVTNDNVENVEQQSKHVLV